MLRISYSLKSQEIFSLDFTFQAFSTIRKVQLKIGSGYTSIGEGFLRFY